MNRIFERAGRNGQRMFFSAETVNMPEFYERRKIGIVGCGKSTGATFAATALALYASELTAHKVAYVQMDGETFSNYQTIEQKQQKTDIYDALGMDKRFAGREFIDFFGLLEQGKSIRGLRNLDEKINWALHIPQEHRQNSYRMTELSVRMRPLSAHKKVDMRLKKPAKDADKELRFLRLINNIAGDFIVCDFGSSMPARKLYEDMDLILCVVDPMPSKLLSAIELLGSIKLMEAKGYEVIWLINKDSSGVNRREFRDFTGLKIASVSADTAVKNKKIISEQTDSSEKSLHSIQKGFSGGSGSDKKKRCYSLPLLDQRDFYRAEYNCEIAAGQKAVRAQTEIVFRALLTEILARLK